MEATNALILVICMVATVVWCGFIWAATGGRAWRRPLAGALVIGALGSLASSVLTERSGAVTVLLMIIHGASAAAVVGGLQFHLWLREKGIERRDRERGR